MTTIPDAASSGYKQVASILIYAKITACVSYALLLLLVINKLPYQLFLYNKNIPSIGDSPVAMRH